MGGHHPLPRVSTFQKSLAKMRLDGVTLDQARKLLRDQSKQHPEADEIVTGIYSPEYSAIDDQIRRRHDACVSGIIGVSQERVDACYVQSYATFLDKLFGENPRSADIVGTRQAYTACLKALQAKVDPDGNAK